MAHPKQLHLALQVYKWQVLCALTFALILLAYNAFISMSFAYGALVILISNGFLTWRVYQKHKSLQPLTMLKGFLTGEVGKYILIALLTIIFAKYVKMDWLFYVLGLALPQIFGVIAFTTTSKGSKK